jgi:hypothetical protein
MDGSYPPTSSQENRARPKRISWAEEPWASESSPLLENGGGSKDMRPVRQSVLKGSRSLSKIGSPHLEQLPLPYYAEPLDQEEEEEEEDSRRGVITALTVLAMLVVISFLSFGRFQVSGPEIPLFPPRPESTNLARNHVVLVKARNGAVATENELCSVIGVQTLKEGGNAADAAVSSTLCVGVVNMFSSGIGGGGFLTIRLPPNSSHSSSEVYTIDFREVAPEGSNSTMFESNPLSSMFGGLSVAVPSEIRGLAEMHKRWGKLPWKQLVEPSAKLARGWKVGPELDRRIQVRLFYRTLFGRLRNGQMYSVLMTLPDWRPIFAPKGKLLREGDLISRDALARTLQTIAEEGPEAFYKVRIEAHSRNRYCC